MKGLWLQGGELGLRDDLPEPAAGTNELLLEVRAAGICGTDIELLSGYATFDGVPGHEFVGRVIAGPSEWTGKRVVASINVGCGECEFCRCDLASHCVNREVIGIRHRNGAFAQRLNVPVSNVHPISDRIADDVAVLVEPLAAAIEITRQLVFTGAEQVLIVGAGRLAQLIAQVLATCVASVDVIVRSKARKAMFAPLDVNTIGAPARQYDIVVECSGNPAGFEVALESVRPRGTVILKSTLAAPDKSSLNKIVVDEISVIGSRCGPFEDAIKWIEAGRLQTRHLRFEHYRLDDHKQAFERARSGDVYKVVFLPD